MGLQITSHIILKHRHSQTYKWVFAEARISVMNKPESLKTGHKDKRKYNEIIAAPLYKAWQYLVCRSKQTVWFLKISYQSRRRVWLWWGIPQLLMEIVRGDLGDCRFSFTSASGLHFSTSFLYVFHFKPSWSLVFVFLTMCLDKKEKKIALFFSWENLMHI